MTTISNRAFVFTDLHFGIHSNNQSYIDICSNTLKWVSDYCSKNSIEDVVFMGDFFDSRTSIDVKTLNSATQSLYSLVDSGIRINLILGNHDIYLRDSTSIHSLLAFGGRSGIRIIDEPDIMATKEGVTALLLPWLYGTPSRKVDVPRGTKFVFSHHNFPPEYFMGAQRRRKNRSDTYCSPTPYEDEYGIQQSVIEEIVRNNGVFFSGHIHQRQEIPVGETAKMIIEGSPYETSWGFNGIKCGAYIVDFDSGQVEFVENPHNKVHVEIRTSDPERDMEGVDFENSIVRLMVDTRESFDTISKLQAKIGSLKPFAVENTRYEFDAAEFAKTDGGVEATTFGGKVSSKLDYILNAIDKTDFSSFSTPIDSGVIDVDKSRLKDIATKIFEATGKKG